MFPSSGSGGSHFNSGSFFRATHPNNQQYSRWGGYSPSPLSPGVPIPLPEDPCTDSITPHSSLQRLPQGAYMQLMQENQQMLSLRERCKVLELQIVKLTSERDTLNLRVLFGYYKQTQASSLIPSFPQYNLSLSALAA
ncbi:hypothetical protein BD769DRAFT_1392240 [Suillus cothurnatus]|nr:hypothetical protein BD769DRAFT_1392240 [Suillus cothurnatus]